MQKQNMANLNWKVHLQDFEQCNATFVCAYAAHPNTRKMKNFLKLLDLILLLNDATGPHVKDRGTKLEHQILLYLLVPILLHLYRKTKMHFKSIYNKSSNSVLNLLCGTIVSCVETIIALSLADKTTAKQTRLSSRALLRPLTIVNKRTQCGSVLGSENLSTQIHAEYDKPVWGGNILSPRRKKQYISRSCFQN